MLVDVALIMVVSKLLGALLAHFHQPAVIGEILGGIELGPSLLGAVAPELHGQLFAPPVLEQLKTLSQLGLICSCF